MFYLVSSENYHNQQTISASNEEVWPRRYTLAQMNQMVYIVA